MGEHKEVETERLCEIALYLAFHHQKAGVVGDSSSFHGIIPCSNEVPNLSRTCFPIFVEIQLWVKAHHHFTTVLRQEAQNQLYQLKTTAPGRLTIASHPREFLALQQTPLGKTGPFLVCSPTCPLIGHGGMG